MSDANDDKFNQLARLFGLNASDVSLGIWLLISGEAGWQPSDYAAATRLIEALGHFGADNIWLGDSRTKALAIINDKQEV